MTLLDEILEKVPPEIVAARDDGAIAEYLSRGRVAIKKVAIADIQAQTQGSGAWRAIKLAARDESHPAHVAADAFMDAATSRYENIDLSLSKVQEMLGGLVLTGLLPQEDMDALVMLSRQPAPITSQEVTQAFEGVNL